MLRIAVVDDNRDRAELLLKFIRRYEQENKEYFVTQSINNIMDFSSDYKPDYDILFIEIDLVRSIDGYSIAQKIRRYDRDVCILFTSGDERFAVRGYEVGALGYLVRPIDYYQFSGWLRRAAETVYAHPEAETIIQSEGIYKRLRLSDIKLVEVLGHSLLWHTTYGKYPGTGQLKDYEEVYENYGFFRCNKSYLVNMKYISEVKKESIMIEELEVGLSRRKKQEFLKSYDLYCSKRFIKVK